MNLDDLVLAAVFVLLSLWFFWRNRQKLKGLTIVRHVVFIGFIYSGCLSFFSHRGIIIRWVFGKEIHKGDPQEFIAGCLPMIACILCFGIGVIALGKHRVRQFNLYVETFGYWRPHAPK